MTDEHQTLNHKSQLLVEKEKGELQETVGSKNNANKKHNNKNPNYGLQMQKVTSHSWPQIAG